MATLFNIYHFKPQLIETTSHLTLPAPSYSATCLAKTGEDICTVFFRSVGLD